MRAVQLWAGKVLASVNANHDTPFQGVTSRTPVGLKSAVLRVTTLILLTRAVEAINASTENVRSANSGNICPSDQFHRRAPWSLSRRSTRRTPIFSSVIVMADMQKLTASCAFTQETRFMSALPSPTLRKYGLNPAEIRDVIDLILQLPDYLRTKRNPEPIGAPMTVRRIVANVAAEPVAEVQAFYTGLFGLDVLMDLGWIVTLGSDRMAKTQMSIMSEGGSGAPVPDLSIEVDDVDAVYARAARMGCNVVHELRDEPWGVRRFFVTDPAGKLINILSHQS